MRKIFILIISLGFIYSNCFGFMQMIGGGVDAGGGPTCEDQTGYTEVDPNSRITKADGTNCKNSFAGLTRGEDAYVYKDMGVDHFSGDFVHQYEIEVTASVSNGYMCPWGVSNVLDDLEDPAAAGTIMYFAGLGTPRIFLRDKTTAVEDSWLSASLNTLYFITVTKDDDAGGSNLGQIVAVIRTGSHAGPVQDTLTIDLTTQEDFRYIYSTSSYNDGTGSATITGYQQNLELNE